MKFDAFRIGRTARRVLRPGTRLRLHSIFERGINLVAGHEELVFLTTASECAPWSVNVSGAFPPHLGGCEGQEPIAFVNPEDSLVLPHADITIDLRTAKVWSREPIVPLAAAEEIRRALDQSGLPRFPPGLTEYGLGEAELTNPSVVPLKGDSYVRELTNKVIGLGRGLTPAGDDLLVGMLGTLALTRRILFSLEIEGRTTLISKTQLGHAMRGEVPESLYDVIHALGCADASISPAVRRLLSFGHTSGRDMLAGVRLGFEQLLRV